MKRRGRVILKFKDRKVIYQVMANKKKLMKKKNETKELYFEESLFLSNSMCTEKHNLFYKFRLLENAKRIFKIFHDSDLEELRRINVDDLLSNSPF